MSYFRVVYKNIKGNFRIYIGCIISLFFSVAFFYMYSSFIRQPFFLEILKSRNIEGIKKDLIDFFLFMIATIMFFLIGIMVSYVNGLINEIRRKEYATYLLLGMSNKRISMLIIFENMVISLLITVIGVLFGVVLSKFLFNSLFRIMGIGNDVLKITICYRSVVETIVIFSVIYMSIVVYGINNTSKSTIIKLLKGNRLKFTRRLFEKDSKVLVGQLLIVVYILIYCMYGKRIALFIGNKRYLLLINCIVVMAVISLYFSSLGDFILFICKKIKYIYYKKINMYGIKNLSLFLKNNRKTITYACMAFIISIFSLSIATSHYNYFVEKLNTVDKNFKNIYDVDILCNDKTILCNMDYRQYFTKYAFYKNAYLSEENIGRGKLFEFNNCIDNMTNIYCCNIEILPLNDLNNVLEFYGEKNLELQENQYSIIYRKEYTDVKIKDGKYVLIGNKNKENILKNVTTGATINGKNYFYKENEVNFDIFKPNIEKMSTVYVVINNIESLKYSYNVIGTFIDKHKEKDFYRDLKEKIKVEEYNNIKNTNFLYGTSYNEKNEIACFTSKHFKKHFAFNESVENVKFIVLCITMLYIGLIFLFIAVGVIVTNIVMDTLLNKENIKILMKLGENSREIMKMNIINNCVIIFLPFIIAEIFAIIALEYCKNMFSIIISFKTVVGITLLFISFNMVVVCILQYFMIRRIRINMRN